MRRGRVAFALAAVCGLLHAAVSAYWAAGGTALLATLGETILTAVGDSTWLLWPVTAVKTLVAVLPLVFERTGWPPLTRALAWLAGAVLVLWGGINTITGNLVLSGIISPAGGYDRDAMIGHAWLWDPLFLIWGLALLVGLWRTRAAARRTAMITNVQTKA
ncbi:uncharacterized protein DUF3995 [Branchiibius hedensis]|uniref:DUF3995 domain-containing protein n=1 Tax=Branchiibius hedensis TaxID=672460 RepID=A0A2Y9C2A1_9MICO|nr:DUF3995 domain-containing protein [Branchiibius hedensis]PWJ26932.1 uncharacterized protein DUF3995 [Branchiibius hedensis]SSA35743.1 Protein of unknown function [Branchiibius hedensis]